MVKLSAETDAASKIVIGIKAIIKRTHLCTGIILIAKYTKKNHIRKLANRAIYINTKGDKSKKTPNFMANADTI